MVIALGPFNVIIEIARYDCRGLFNREQADMARSPHAWCDRHCGCPVDGRRRSIGSSRSWPAPARCEGQARTAAPFLIARQGCPRCRGVNDNPKTIAVASARAREGVDPFLQRACGRVTVAGRTFHTHALRILRPLRPANACSPIWASIRPVGVVGYPARERSSGRIQRGKDISEATAHPASGRHANPR
jgi:hypothetical protein